MKNFHDKVIVITGAGAGLGRALAVHFHQAGAHLALCDVNLAGLEETRALLPGPSAQTSLHQVDVSDMAQMAQFADAVIAQHGQVDVLINNAGITLMPVPFEDITDVSFNHVVDVNMWGVYNGIRVFLSHLRARPEASLVTISSLAGLVGLTGYGPYALSKFAVRGLSEVVQMESAGTGLHVLVVHPGGVKTDIVKNAINLTDAQRENAHKMFTQVSLLTADKAARRIVRALQRKKLRLILGVDAKLVYAVRHLFPRRYPAMLNFIFGQMTFNQTVARKQ